MEKSEDIVQFCQKYMVFCTSNIVKDPESAVFALRLCIEAVKQGCVDRRTESKLKELLSDIETLEESTGLQNDFDIEAHFQYSFTKDSSNIDWSEWQQGISLRKDKCVGFINRFTDITKLQPLPRYSLDTSAIDIDALQEDSPDKMYRRYCQAFHRYIEMGHRPIAMLNFRKAMEAWAKVFLASQWKNTSNFKNIDGSKLEQLKVLWETIEGNFASTNKTLLKDVEYFITGRPEPKKGKKAIINELCHIKKITDVKWDAEPDLDIFKEWNTYVDKVKGFIPKMTASFNENYLAWKKVDETSAQASAQTSPDTSADHSREPVVTEHRAKSDTSQPGMASGNGGAKKAIILLVALFVAAGGLYVFETFNQTEQKVPNRLEESPPNRLEEKASNEIDARLSVSCSDVDKDVILRMKLRKSEEVKAKQCTVDINSMKVKSVGKPNAAKKCSVVVTAKCD